MRIGSDRTGARGLAALRAFLETPAAEEERCDLCSAPLREQHPHLVDPKSRRLLCACEPCAILFPGKGETNYRRVPREARLLPDFQMFDATWNSLGIPIGLAFLFQSSASGKMLAVYPSPAGPTETALDEEAWNEIVLENPGLRSLTADVEALLVNRMRGGHEYFIAPIDQCYRLTGIVRKHWRGFSGGENGWAQIEQFFADLRERSYAGSFI